jgi:hypothetical protein
VNQLDALTLEPPKPGTHALLSPHTACVRDARACFGPPPARSPVSVRDASVGAAAGTVAMNGKYLGQRSRLRRALDVPYATRTSAGVGNGELVGTRPERAPRRVNVDVGILSFATPDYGLLHPL